MKLYSYAALAFIAMASTAHAHEFKVGALVVDHPMAFETASTAMSGGGYLSVTNTGTTDDRLIGVEADFPRVMLHTTTMNDGIASMSHVEMIDIPAGETVMLAPGGYHVMFMGLDGDPFEVGEKVPATLIFENAGSLDVVFNVAARDAEAKDEMDHSDH